MVLDGTAFFRANYRDVDFRPFEAMVRLRELRLCLISRQHIVSGHSLPLTELLGEILERVPRGCRVECGVDDVDGDDDAAAGYAAMARAFVDEAVRTRQSAQRSVVYETGDEVLRAGVACIAEERRGVKNGASRDVFGDENSYWNPVLGKRVT